jgi:hypothetical protein
MERFLEIPPIVILLAVAAVYAGVLFARSSWREALLAVYVAVLLSLLVLPGGREAVSRAKGQVSSADRVSCLAGAVVRGVPWRQASAIGQVPACGTVQMRSSERLRQPPQTPGAAAVRSAF